MELIQRRILLAVFVLIFIILAPIIILYSQGYGFDLQKGKIIKTGGIFIKARPDGAEVYLNSKLIKKTFIIDEVKMMNLLPRQYNIEIKKDGYFPWKKNLMVKEREVTSAKNITLFPKEHTFSEISFDTKGKVAREAIISPDFKTAVIYLSGNSGWEIDLLDLKTGSQKKIFPSSSADRQHSFRNFEFSPNGNGRLALNTEYWGKKYAHIFFEPNSNMAIKTTLPLEAQNAFYGHPLQMVSSTIKTALAYEISNDGLIWLSEDGYLSKNAYGNGKKIKIFNSSPLETIPQDKINIIENNSSELFLVKNSSLYYLDPKTTTFNKILANANNFVFGPYPRSFEIKKAAISSGSSLYVFYMTPDYEQPERREQELAKIADFNNPIEEIFWLNGHYILLRAGDKILITEIDNRDVPNIIEVADYKNPKVFYNYKEKILYIFSEGRIYVSNPLFE